MSIEDKKWLFKCRVEDLDIRGNQRWKYSDINYQSCKTNVEETQEHILICPSLLGKNEKLTYIPNYYDLYNGNIEE